MNFSPENLIKNEKPLFIYWFRRIFVNDWLIKLFAVIITLSLWYGVTGLRAPITTRLNRVTLSPRISNDLEITNSPPEEVDLVITGDKNRIAQINKENLVVSLDLTEVQAGDRTIQLTPESVNVELPTGVRLEEIQPNRIAISLERVEEREIAVRVETEGSLADGFEIYNQNVVPPKVRVRGPASYIRSLDFVSTESIGIEDRRQDFIAQQVPLNIINPKVTVLDAVVDVAFDVGERRIERLFSIPYQTETRLGVANAIVYGPRSIIEKLQTENLQVIEETPAEGKPTLRVVVPEELQNQVQVKSVKFRE
ncbi:MAG TPA: CdaR family protein [Pyrinomonadaceae bacterium]|nr:CdaR family protein [Pyrinomonadaceae bacterium]